MENYAQLKSDIKSWTSSPDLTDAELDNCITVTISRINREMRFRGMETLADLTVDAQEVALPSDFRGARSLYLDSSEAIDVRYMPPEVLDSLQRTGTGQPRYFTIRNATIRFDVAPDETYTGKLHYYQKFETLSDSNETNWLTDNAPDLLLWGSCMAASLYTRDDKQMGTFATLYEQALDGLSESDADVHGPAPVMRTEGSYP